MLPSKAHVLKGDPCPGGKHSKLRVTVSLYANMNRSHRIKPFMMGRSKKPTCFRSDYIPVRNCSNKKTWMTRDLFSEWLCEFGDLIEGQGRKVFRLLNNCSTHTFSPELTSVKLMFLPPNATAGLQPLNAGVITNFKLYQLRVLECLI